MTLAELAAETLVEKNRRKIQAKCRHEAVHASTFLGPQASFTDRICLDCGKHWRVEHTSKRF